MRAAIYVRVSSEEQAKCGYSLDYQAAACEERARRLGATEVAVYRDEGVSGAVLARPGLTRLRETLRQGGVDLIVVLDPDRFARNVVHQLLITEEIERSGATLEFVNFEWRNTPEGQLFYAIRGAVAQYEKEKIRERTMAGRIQKARAGRMPQAHRPYGYAYDPEAATLVPHPAESAVVRTIYDLFVRDGLSYVAIARRLDALGIPPRSAPHWHRQVIRQILTNPVYTGIFWANRYDCKDLALNRYRPPEERRRPLLRDRDQWIAVPVPPLVDPARWQAAQERVAAGLARQGSRSRRAYLLKGLVRCAVCGAPARAQQVRARPHPYAYYFCPGTHPEKVRWSAGLLEGAVWAWTKETLYAPECLAEVLRDTRDLPAEDPEAALARLEKETGRLGERRAAASRAFAAGLCDRREWETVLRQTSVRTAALAEERKRLEARLLNLHRNNRELIAAACRILDAMDDLETENRRRLVERMVDAVLIGPGEEVTIHVRVSRGGDFTWCQREGNPDAPACREKDAGGGLPPGPDRG
ncbi:MAG: recombinase family protein [Thermoanaerobacterales bacterium]|nr:recombinase family protein [Bacillota bacterium]MDI6906728.1 recombinase family protein [Thermoanaerobacterales bacterium]